MRLYCSIVLAFAFLSIRAKCQIPNVYEFCSALMEDRRPNHSQPGCRKECQGRPGKRGPIGEQGPPGLKGDQGIQGTCDDVEERQRLFEAEMKKIFDLIPKLSYCSLGMKSNEIPDEMITASSFVDHRFAPHFARLDSRVGLSTSATSTIEVASWCPKTNNVGEWIQIDLETPKSVAGVVIQGRPKNQWGNQCWVKTFKISCGHTVDELSTIMENGSEKIFVGNTDKDSHVIKLFSTSMTCRFVRLYPLTWNTVSPWVRACLRMELIKGECHDLF
uniref:lactadherin-like isoform X1 n=1 Tax=Styela clava TaxID=7725 RepID=UPI001939C8ED|nr:lactadherin-like isoform X1 [Styela clava]